MFSNKIFFITAFAVLIFFGVFAFVYDGALAAGGDKIVIGAGGDEEKTPQISSPAGPAKEPPARSGDDGKIVIGASREDKNQEVKNEDKNAVSSPGSNATEEVGTVMTADGPSKSPPQEPSPAPAKSSGLNEPAVGKVLGNGPIETAESSKVETTGEIRAQEEAAKVAPAEKAAHASNGAGGSEGSAEKIAPPAGLNASVSGGKVRLSWTEVEGAHHYNIYRDSTGAITKKSAKYNTNQNEFEDEDAREGETYYYFVTTAVKKNGGKTKYIESAPAGPLKVETVDKTPPGAVEGLKVEYAENGKVRLSWSKPGAGPEAARYIIFRGETGATADLKEIKIQDAPYFEEEGLENEKPYHYSVAAVSKNGVKGPAAGPIAVKLKDTIAPAPPGKVSAAASSAKIELGWERPADADVAYYTIYKSEDGGNDYKKISTPSLITEERYTDTAVKAGREYFYKITASDKCANESKPCEPAVRVKIKLPVNMCFARTGEKSYCGFAYEPEQRSLYMTESSDGKSWSWWTLIVQSLPLPDGYSDEYRLAFARDGKKITAFVYDTEKMSISAAVSNDDGRNWKWWEVYSSSLPLPDGFDENARIDFSVRGDTVYCICFNPSSGTLFAASTTDGKSWKWWKKFGEGLSELPNQTAASLNSACFYGGQFEAFSYNPDDKTLYKGVLTVGKTNYSSWNEVANKFPAPPCVKP